MNLKATSLVIVAAGSMMGVSQANAGGSNVYFQVGWHNGYGNHLTVSNRPHYGHGHYITYKPVKHVHQHHKKRHVRSHWKQRHHHHGHGHYKHGHKKVHQGGYNRW